MEWFSVNGTIRSSMRTPRLRWGSRARGGGYGDRGETDRCPSGPKGAEGVVAYPASAHAGFIARSAYGSCPEITHSKPASNGLRVYRTTAAGSSRSYPTAVAEQAAQEVRHTGRRTAEGETAAGQLVATSRGP